jgi:predicted permease
VTVTRLARILRQRLRSLWLRERADAELDREFEFHLEQLVAEHAEAGMTLREAREAARRALGNLPLLEEQCRDHRRVNWLHDVWQDSLHGLRMLRQNPGFTLVAAASLALGIGANTAILGVMQKVMLGELPFRDADRLVIVRTFPLDAPARRDNASLPQYLAWKEQAPGFESMGASLPQEKDFGAQDGSPAERIPGQGFSPVLFQVLGAQPLLGRLFTEEEGQMDHAAHVIVLSYRLWQTRFGGDANILHKQVLLSGVSTEIIGVMPPEFHYPIDETAYWTPLSLTRIQLRGTANYFTVTARLKTGVSMQQVQGGLQTITSDLDKELGVRVQPLREAALGWARQPLLTLEAAVMLVLLIACANVAGLLLARGSARAPELAMRAALGAGRGRIVRQLLAESVLLSLIGGVMGLAVAWIATRGLIAMTPPPGGLPVSWTGNLSGLDLRVLGWTALISMLTGLIFGTGPALASARGFSGRRRSQWLQPALVAAQIALALVALTGSGLLMKSFLRLAAHDLNFQPEGLLSFEFRMPIERYLHLIGSYNGFPYAEISPPPSLLMQRLHDRLRAIPGVTSAAGMSSPVLDSLLLPNLTFRVEGSDQATSAEYFLVTPNLFATLGAPLERGRDFNLSDGASAPWVAIVNETAARQFWPGADALGKRFTLDIVPDEQPREVIGVVRDIPLHRRQSSPQPVVYTSYLQQPTRYRGPWDNIFGQMTFLLRTPGEPMNLLPAARSAAAEIEPAVPLSKVHRLERIGPTERGFRDYALAVSLFAAIAVLLAAIGIYGVMSYAVARRTREIGIRIALGAHPLQVTGLVSGYAFRPVAAGLILGLAGSLAVTRLIASQLWGVNPFDPATFAGVLLVLVFVAVMACLIPGKRAIQVDPTIALRTD